MPINSVNQNNLVADDSRNRNFAELHLKLHFNAVYRAQHQLLIDSILAFFKTNKIFIYANAAVGESNLLPEEISSLQFIVDAAQKTNLDELTAQNTLQAQLAEWKKTLKHAVAGAGADIALYAAQRILTTDLIKNKKVKLTELGTDYDIIKCLGSDITDPKNIRLPGTYVINPCALITTSIQKIIDETLRASKQTSGKIKLLIPVNCGNSHWRLAKIEIENQAVSKAVLWDSLLDEEIKKTIYYGNLQTAIENPLTVQSVMPLVTVEVIPAGIQTNSHSCMDYVIQQIYNDLRLDNEITDAKEAKGLRLAVIKQIATNVPELGQEFADNLKIKGDSVVEEIEFINADLSDEQEKFLKEISKGGSVKAVQESFDLIFANRIEKLQTSIRNDSKLQKVAFLQAFSIFKQKNPVGVKRVLDTPAVSKP
jgi:hypothetical protein